MNTKLRESHAPTRLLLFLSSPKVNTVLISNIIIISPQCRVRQTPGLVPEEDSLVLEIMVETPATICGKVKGSEKPEARPLPNCL